MHHHVTLPHITTAYPPRVSYYIPHDLPGFTHAFTIEYVTVILTMWRASLSPRVLPRSFVVRCISYCTFTYTRYPCISNFDLADDSNSLFTDILRTNRVPMSCSTSPRFDGKPYFPDYVTEDVADMESVSAPRGKSYVGPSRARTTERSSSQQGGTKEHQERVQFHLIPGEDRR